MKYETAAKWIITFGKFKGKRIDEIGSRNDGLKYLDWLVGQDWLNSGTREAIKTYLGTPSIAKDLEDIIEDEG
jgi:hypothetical protein